VGGVDGRGIERWFYNVARQTSAGVACPWMTPLAVVCKAKAPFLTTRIVADMDVGNGIVVG
jgi:hypothetical protein